MKLLLLIILFMLPVTAEINAQQWSPQQSNTDEPLHSIFFIEPNYGWAVGENGTIVHTSDKGNNWAIQSTRSSDRLNAVYFFDDLTGWIAGNENTLLYTNDAGNTWSDRRPSPVPGQHLTSIQFIDWKRGWAAGGPGGNIYYTDDAGLTWQRQGLSSVEHTIEAIHFNNHEKGWAAYQNTIVHTTDGGQNWNEQNQISELESFEVSDITFLNDTIGFAIGNYHEEGIILKSENGGKNWQTIYNLPQQTLQALFFLTKETGWITGSNGNIIHTTDGGESWSSQQPPSSEEIYGVHFTKNRHGWLVDSGGTIFTHYFDEPDTELSFDFDYPEFRFADENEAVELLNRVLHYVESVDDISEPNVRRPYIQHIRGAVSEASRFYAERETPDVVSERIFELITGFWADEHNAGVDAFNEADDSMNGNELLNRAKNHFINAVIIQPDSAQSYLTLSYTLEKLGEVDGAILSFESGLEKLQEPQIDDYDFLISLYIQSDKNELAYELSQKAANQYPEEIVFKEYLTDYYIETGQYENAVEHIDELIDLNPQNLNYYYIRATQKFEPAFRYLEQTIDIFEEIWRLRERKLADIPESERQRLQIEIDNLLNDVNELQQLGGDMADQIISDLEHIIEQQPENENAHSLLAFTSKNRASIYIEKSSLTHEPGEIEQFDRQIENDLNKALIHFEILTELNPGNHEYWESLYEVYMHLGMRDRAQRIINRF